MLLSVGCLGSFAMFFYGGSGMIYALWMVLLGLGVYLFGLFSRPLLEWIGLATILLGVAGLAATPMTMRSAPVAPSRPEPIPHLDIEAAYAAARVLARDMPSGGVPRQDRFARADARLQDRPILPQLDRALQREVAGERMLTGGVMRIVSADGRAYCLQKPSDFARGGPVEATSVPMLCQ